MNAANSRPSRILVTGGAGYIGSHTVLRLLESGYQVEIIDNLSNGHLEAVRRVEKMTGTQVPVHVRDANSLNDLDSIFANGHFDACIHFAGYKSVSESIHYPITYYRNNLGSTLALLETMTKHAVAKLVFSSSASVYGEPSTLPITESSNTGLNVANPYGRTKWMIEQILKDVSASQPSMSITALRYFNPIGAHSSGLIGEDSGQAPTNIAPYIAQVASGQLESVKVFGDRYDTTDGSGVRDYIHVLDLADGHIAALEDTRSGLDFFNLGTGRGTSVLELVAMFEKAVGRSIPFEIAPARNGDVGASYADASKAKTVFGWEATRTVAEACSDAWRWQQMNPNGF
jgi:UDP-glucose 4-epimerase